MEKNALLALILTLVVLFIFQIFLLPPPQKIEKPTIKEQKEEVKRELKVKNTFKIETPLLLVEISDLGGGIRSVRLKKYKEDIKEGKEKEMIEDIRPFLYLPRVLWDGTDDSLYFECDKKELTVNERSEKLACRGIDSQGTEIKKVYTFYPNQYVIDLEIEGPSANKIEFAVISPKKSRSYVFKGPVVYTGRLNQIAKIKEDLTFGREYRYAGFDEGYFAFLFIPLEKNPVLSIKKRQEIPVLEFKAEERIFKGRLYFGPKRSDVLKELKVEAQKIINFGWFDFIAKPLVLWLNLTNRVTHNYGFDIIILTVIIKIIFYPLTLLSYKSMKEMQRLQPYIQKLREKYKDDKQKLNQELMELYRRKKINPMSGCLPMLIQIPVFIALYKALSSAIELRHAPFVLWIKDLSSPETLFSFSLFGFSVPIRALPLIMGFTQYIQQKMSPTSLDPMQEKMMLFMPIFFTFLFYGFSSGLVLYWLINNVVSILQQYYINKKVR